MKFLTIIFGIIFLLIFNAATAIPVTDVRTFNRIIENGEEFQLFYNLADYGFVPERDTVVGRPILTFEFRDPKDGPDRDDSERPFISLFIDQGRSFTRVFTEDWVLDNGLPFFNEAGLMTAFVRVDVDDVWLGDVILNFEFVPGPVQVSEPAPFILMGLGLLAISSRRRMTNAYRFKSNRPFFPHSK